jgi:hypothetical protein
VVLSGLLLWAYFKGIANDEVEQLIVVNQAY